MNVARYNRLREWSALTGEDAAIFRRKLPAFIGLNAATMDHVDLNIIRYHIRMAQRLGVSALQREQNELRVRQETMFFAAGLRGPNVLPFRRP